MDKYLQLFKDNELVRDLVISATWLVGALMLRTAADRMVRKKAWSSDRLSLQWLAQIRAVTVVLIIGGLFLIWATELRTMALSLTALAAALVIATREAILCIMGSLLRATSQAFSIGDRIEIAGVRGDVIDHGLFTTTILEIGPTHLWTGRALTLPNGLLLSEAVVNETFATQYVLHVIRIPVLDDAMKDGAKKRLLEIGERACAEYLDEAREHLVAHAIEHGFQRPRVDPRVSIAIPDVGKLDLLLRIPTPARSKGDIEQQVLQEFLDGPHSGKKEDAPPPKGKKKTAPEKG